MWNRKAETGGYLGFGKPGSTSRSSSSHRYTFRGKETRELARRLTVMPTERIPIVPAELGLRAGAIGAALWGMQAESAPGGLS